MQITHSMVSKSDSFEDPRIHNSLQPTMKSMDTTMNYI